MDAKLQGALINLEQGKVALLEVTLADGSPADGKTVGDLKMPPDCTLVAVVRQKHVIAPSSETPLQAGDEVLALAAQIEAERPWAKPRPALAAS